MKRDTIEINKSIIPYDFRIVLGDEEYTLKIDYNNEGRFFTVGLSKNGEVLCAGEPIVYGRRLFEDIRTPKFPPIDIVPIDPAREYNAVTYANLCDGVSLVIDNADETVVGW